MSKKIYLTERTRLNVHVSGETEGQLQFIVNVLGVTKIAALELAIAEYYAKLEPIYKGILDLANEAEKDANKQT